MARIFVMSEVIRVEFGRAMERSKVVHEAMQSVVDASFVEVFRGHESSIRRGLKTLVRNIKDPPLSCLVWRECPKGEQS